MNAIISQLDKQKHKVILMSILLNISKNVILKKLLVFKWWTSLFLLYNLDRFSTDLDFDLIENKYEYDVILDEIVQILSQYGTVKNSYIKKNTIFSLLSYWEIDHNIKIEISTRWVSWKYSLKNFMWIKVNVLDIEYITANKFLALTRRDKLANRDIYDVWFILKNNLPINSLHIKNISGESFEQYIKFMITFLGKLWEKHNILDWLWSTLNEKQKSFVKIHLLSETIFLLHSLI